MEIYTSLDQINISEKTSVALGNFDGLHEGHRVIMEDAIRSAKEQGLRSLCFTFSNHPFNFILQRSDDDPDAVKLICTEEEKIELVRGMGFDILVNVPFDETIGAGWIIPVPLHPKRLSMRGFNQSELLAKSVAKAEHLITTGRLLFNL